MEQHPFPDCPPSAEFADAWRLPNHHAAERHPLCRAALFTAILALELSLLALLDYRPSIIQPEQPAMIMVQLRPYRPVVRLKELALQFAKAHAPKVAAPQFTIMPDTTPAPKSTMPVTMALTSPLAGGTPQGGGSGAGGASGGGGSKALACVDAGYLAEISRHIQKYFFYPADTTGKHLQGAVYIHFISNRTGSYQLTEIAKSSGNPVLDQAALLIMRRASPLPAIPDRLHANLVDGVVPIVFELKGINLNLNWTVSGDC